MPFLASGPHNLYVVLLIMLRASGLVVSAPMLGSKTLPPTMLMGISFLLAICMAPMASHIVGPLPVSLVVLGFQAVQNLLFGLAIGYTARLMFAAVEIAGAITDLQMGFGFINLVDPFSQQQVSLVGAFYYQLSIVLYMMMNGHLLLIGALEKSLQVLPPDQIGIGGGVGPAIFPLIKVMLLLGLQLALPAIGVLLLVDVGFGLMARMAPQVNIFIVGMPAKILMGLMTVSLLVPALALIVGQIIPGIATGLNALMTGAR